MIEKSLAAPSCSRYRLEFPFSSLRQEGKIKSIRLSHLKAENGAFVCAEGKSNVLNRPENIVKIHTPTNQYGYSLQYFNFLFIGSGSFQNMGNVNRVLDCFDRAGNKYIIGIYDSMIYRFKDNTSTLLMRLGGTCAATHCERIFFGNGYRLYYSPIMNVETWTTSSTYGGGYIDFVEEKSKIVELVSFNGKLYVFHENGVTALTALADPLNFRAVSLPYACGAIKENSTVLCKDTLYFFTENGFFSFDGTQFKRVENSDTQDFDLSAEISCAEYRGDYYALVKLRDGTSVLYSYDCQNKMGRFLGFSCRLISANNKFYFAEGTWLCKMEGTALPASGEYSLRMCFTADEENAGTTFLESITAEGTGNVTFSIQSKEGGTLAVQGSCGETVRLPRALRGGEFTLKILPEDESFRLNSVSFGMRRDGNDN